MMRIVTGFQVMEIKCLLSKFPNAKKQKLKRMTLSSLDIKTLLNIKRGPKRLEVLAIHLPPTFLDTETTD